MGFYVMYAIVGLGLVAFGLIFSVRAKVAGLGWRFETCGKAVLCGMCLGMDPLMRAYGLNPGWEVFLCYALGVMIVIPAVLDLHFLDDELDQVWLANHVWN